MITNNIEYVHIKRLVINADNGQEIKSNIILYNESLNDLFKSNTSANNDLNAVAAAAENNP